MKTKNISAEKAFDKLSKFTASSPSPYQIRCCGFMCAESPQALFKKFAAKFNTLATDEDRNKAYEYALALL